MNLIINFGEVAIRADRIEVIREDEHGGCNIFMIGNNGGDDCYFVDNDFESVLIKWHAALATTTTTFKDDNEPR